MNKTIDIKLELTPKEIAQEFCRMNSEEQALIFNSIADIVSNDWNAPFSYQLEFITDEEVLSEEGRNVMSQIGEYSKRA